MLLPALLLPLLVLLLLLLLMLLLPLLVLLLPLLALLLLPPLVGVTAAGMAAGCTFGAVAPAHTHRHVGWPNGNYSSAHSAGFGFR